MVRHCDRQLFGANYLAVCNSRYVQPQYAVKLHRLLLILLLTLPDCLTRNNYNEARCQDVIKALYTCCESFYERHGDNASSPSCPKPSLLRLKMKQLNEKG
ncbi:hypothetical protein IF2G_05211 [Cordyceps javanica]|nr:hypothetical protein IF2G_05211 [Cordyceps javanica]